MILILTCTWHLPHVEKKMTLYFKSAAFMDGDCRHIPMSHTPNVRHYRTTLRTNRFICSKISNIWYLHSGGACLFVLKWITFAQINIRKSHVLNREGLIPIAICIPAGCHCPTIPQSRANLKHAQLQRKRTFTKVLGKLRWLRISHK